MATDTEAPAERVRLQRQLAEVAEGWRDAARRRRVARDHGDTVGEATAQTALEAAFRTRDAIVARLAELGPDDHRQRGGPVRPSGG